MPATYKILNKNDQPANYTEKQAFGLDVLHGLSSKPKRLLSKYFYDEEGSRLFQKITDLPEYYLTNCEIDILETHKDKLGTLFKDHPFNLVELGAGDGKKTNILIEYFLSKGLDFEYVPIDISDSSMKTLTDSLNNQFPQLKANGIVAEYFEGLKWLSEISYQKNLVLFLGSNIGNFNHNNAFQFLRNLWNQLNHDDYLLIGFDKKKNIDILINAYNDSMGITKSFNLNLLFRINRELDANFDLNKFNYYSTYNPFSGAMESCLISMDQQSVLIKELQKSFSFDIWEPIHMEYSYKYIESEIEKLADETGFIIQNNLSDSKNYFVDSIWRVQKLDAAA